jgi:hypothetical protein
MITNVATRTLFIEVPKTGSTTIRVAFQDKHGRQKYSAMWTHVKRNQLERAFAELHPGLPLETFTRYAFYRDPVSRIVSGWRYSVRQWETARAQPETNVRVYTQAAAMFHLLWRIPFDEEAKPSLAGVTLDHYLDALEAKVMFPTLDLVTPQTEYMDENTVLLDYANYTAEYARLAELLDLPPVLAPHMSRLNASDSAEFMPLITAEQVRRIKAYYKKDYEFFAAKGITFPEHALV